MEYTIIGAKRPAELIKLVNEYIKLGWKLQGGVCGDEYYLYQAMIKE